MFLFAVVLSTHLLFSTAAQAILLDVSLKTGTFRGASTSKGTEQWLGLRYAKPPLGPLRFKAPVPITEVAAGMQNATSFGNACAQPGNGMGAPISEDCLFLNVWRPEGTTAASKLPVLVWIHGGSYITGAASQDQYDPSLIIQTSVALNKPIIFVSINYRLNSFGFLASSTLPPEDLNAGLQDQRQALVFIQENIAAFGGDHSKVTIWGWSAGAGSVETHFLYPTSQSLFRAGIADSSTGPFKNSPNSSTYDKQGMPFARLLEKMGCSAGPGAVDCLREVPFKKLMKASNDMITSTPNYQLWQPAIGPEGSMLPERASARIASGSYLNLPYLGGTNVNEGTIFSSNVRNRRLFGEAEDSAFQEFISHLYIDPSAIPQEIYNQTLALYPANDTSLGAPHNTGDSLFDRAEAWYTDAMFLAGRRSWFEAASAHQSMFAYYFCEDLGGGSYGVSHGSELQLLFGPVPGEKESAMSEQMLTYYINFINDLNPGGDWARYSTETKGQVMQLLSGNFTMIPDDWSKNKTDFFNSQAVLDAFEKRQLNL